MNNVIYYTVFDDYQVYFYTLDFSECIQFLFTLKGMNKGGYTVRKDQSTIEEFEKLLKNWKYAQKRKQEEQKQYNDALLKDKKEDFQKYEHGKKLRELEKTGKTNKVEYNNVIKPYVENWLCAEDANKVAEENERIYNLIKTLEDKV